MIKQEPKSPLPIQKKKKKKKKKNKFWANNIILPLLNIEIFIFKFQVYLWAKELFLVHFLLD